MQFRILLAIAAVTGQHWRLAFVKYVVSNTATALGLSNVIILPQSKQVY